jgi:hypothetical protein
MATPAIRRRECPDTHSENRARRQAAQTRGS